MTRQKPEPPEPPEPAEPRSRDADRSGPVILLAARGESAQNIGTERVSRWRGQGPGRYVKKMR